MASSKSVAKKAVKQPEMAHAFTMNVPKHLDKYEVENAASHLERHQEVLSNKKLHAAAKKHLKKKHKAIGKAIKGS